MAKAYLLGASLLFWLSAPTWAQAPAQSNAHYTLRGSVVNSVTGEAIHKAIVNVNGTPSSKTVSTGPDGQFEMEGLQAGTYFVSANRPGYVDPRMTGGLFAPVQLGPDTGPLTIKLTPFGRIAGRVLDTDGEPVPNLSIQAIQRTLVNGHASWQPNAMANTDEGGNYVLDMLPPGKFLVTTVEQQVYPGQVGDDRASRLSYRREYFPNAPDITAAQPIEVDGGQSVPADFTVSEIAGAGVSFSVVPPQQWVAVTLRDANGEELRRQATRNGRTGEWMLSGLTPGTWRLEIDANGNGQQQMSGAALVEVGDSDIRNVVVALSPANQVPIVYTGDSEQASGGNPANVMLLSSSTHQVNMYGSTPTVNPKGNHSAIFGLQPGNYRVQIGASPTQCVDSITSGASDLARVDYVIPDNGTPQPISVGMGTDCGTIAFSPKQSVNGMFFVVIVGGVHALEPLLLGGGESISAKLAPGEYDVYAFPNANNVEYANPDVLKNFVSRRISVSNNQNTSIKLDLNNTEGK